MVFQNIVCDYIIIIPKSENLLEFKIHVYFINGIIQIG